MAPLTRTIELNTPVYLPPTVGGEYGNRERVDAIRMIKARDAFTFQRVDRSRGFSVLDNISLDEARDIAKRGGGLRQS